MNFKNRCLIEKYSFHKKLIKNYDVNVLVLGLHDYLKGNTSFLDLLLCCLHGGERRDTQCID